MLSRFRLKDLQIEVNRRELLKLIPNNSYWSQVGMPLLYDEIGIEVRTSETL